MAPEKRWFQKPEFIFTICTFLLVQGATFWRSSVNQAKSDTNQRRDFEEFKRTQEGFNKNLLERMSNFEQRQEDVLRAWNTEHDGVNTLTGRVDTQRKDFDSFVSRYDQDKRLQDTWMATTRERVIKIESKMEMKQQQP